MSVDHLWRAKARRWIRDTIRENPFQIPWEDIAVALEDAAADARLEGFEVAHQQALQEDAARHQASKQNTSKPPGED